jgi:Ser/Thr protein kinase RdoA (MazF antagonist)
VNQITDNLPLDQTEASPQPTVAGALVGFADLTPDCVWQALDNLGLHGNSSLLALNSYENRVYQLGMDDGPPLIGKFYRPGRWSNAAIQEEHDFTLALAEAEIPVVAPLVLAGQTLQEHAGYRFALYPRRGGRAPALDQPEVLERIGRFIGRVHAMGAVSAFVHRQTLSPQTLGHDSLAFLLAHADSPQELRLPYQTVAVQALEMVGHCYQRGGAITPIRLHGDCHASNILWTDAGPHFVDFDDAQMGPPLQDLWMLLSGDRHEQSRQLADILAGYEDFFEFETAQLYLLEALRTLRLLGYAAWLARRWGDPAFRMAFPWFNTNNYWQDRILELREQISLMSEAPLWPV